MLVAQHIKQIHCSRPPFRYLTQTAHASISSSASISLKCYCLSVHSVGAFLRASSSPDVCQCLQGETSVYNVYLFFIFIFFFLPPNSDSFSAPQWSQSAVQTARFPPCPCLPEEDTNAPPRPQQRRFAAIPPFFLSLCLNTCLSVCLFIYCMEREKNPVCPVVFFFCAFCGDSLCACAWPQRHFTQLSHPIASSTAASPSPLSSAGGGQRGQVQGSRLPIGRGGLIVSVGWFQELLHSFIFDETNALPLWMRPLAEWNQHDNSGPRSHGRAPVDWQT